MHLSSTLDRKPASINGVHAAFPQHGKSAESHAPHPPMLFVGVDPGVALFDIRTMDEHLANALLFQRVTALLFGVTGLIGLVIAALGLYGVISFLAVRQTKAIAFAWRSEQAGDKSLSGFSAMATLTISGCWWDLVPPFSSRGESLLSSTAWPQLIRLRNLVVPLFLRAIALALAPLPAFGGECYPLDSIRYQ